MIPLLQVSCLLFSTEKQTAPDYIINKETNKQIIKQIKDERILFNFPIFLVWDSKCAGNSGMSHAINATLNVYIKQSEVMEQREK